MTADPARELNRRLAALTPEQRTRLEQRIGPTTATASAPPIPTQDPPHPFPMTDIQQAYWAGRSNHFRFGNVATHSYSEIDSVDLDLPRLNAAWNRLVVRHDMLRAIFLPDGRQRILESVSPYEIARDDLRGLSPQETEERLASLRERMSHQVLRTDLWPIFEIRASLLDGRRARLHLSFDAIVADLSSRQLLLQEWGEIYRDAGAALTPLAGSFREFVLAEQAGRSSRSYEAARKYWLGRADALPPAPDLPQSDDGAIATPRFTRRTRRLDAGAREALRHIAAAAGVSLNMLLLLAYSDVLRMWSRSDAFTLTLTLFNRPAGNLTVGDFTSLTMLEMEAPGARTIGERAAALQARLWRDLDHRQFSGVEVLREIARRRPGSPGPIMPYVFTSALASEGAGSDPIWLGEEIYGVSQTPQVWLDLMVIGTGDGLTIYWNSVDALFPPELMTEMFQAFARLLDALAAGTLLGASRWPEIAATLLPGDARRRQDAANATAGPLPERLLHEPWQEQARFFPDRPAIISAQTTISYGRLKILTDSLATRIRTMGVRPNRLVAVVMHKGWEQVAAVLAILEAGAAYLPIDPTVPAARLHYLLADGEVNLALTQPSLMEGLAWPDGLRLLAIEADEAATTVAARSPAPDRAPAMTDLAYVIHTSGSSGQPKGVAIDHRGACNTVEDINQRFAISPSDRVLALSALTFDLSVYDIFGVLGAGGAIVMPDPHALRDPASWAHMIERHDVTLWNTAPALMEMLADYYRLRARPENLALRLVLLSGDRISTALPPAIRAFAPAARIVSLGGATEASIWSIYYEIAGLPAGSATIPYGKPLRNQTVRLLSPTMQSCPTWVEGDLHIGGVGLARGYWRDPDRTAVAFVRDERTCERLYRTGDRGRYLPDGNIEFLGRRDNQVKLRGFRVELGEVESVLLRHPAVTGAAVVAVGESSIDRSLRAYVVLSRNAPPPICDIMLHLRRQLPEYMIPSSIVPLADLPVTANGKVDRRSLSAPLPVPEPAIAAAAPDTARVARLVRRACARDIPTLDSNLLELGLTSIDMIRIVTAMESELGVRPAIDALYTSPTIRWLASDAAARQPASRGAPEPTIDPPHDGTPATDGQGLALPRAPRDDGSQARRSVRRYALRPIRSMHFGQLLEAIGKDPDNGHYRYGSASGLYPVRAYLYAKPGRIEGLARGAYRYVPLSHQLLKLEPAYPLSRAAFSFFQNAPIFDEAAFALFLVADMHVIEPAYADRALRLATIEAGLMTQALESAAPLCGLGLCQIGSLDDCAVGRLLGLAPSHRFLHALVGGYPDSSLPVDAGGEGSEEARLKRLFQQVGALAPAEVDTLLAGRSDESE